jgi:hypothetical protein
MEWHGLVVTCHCNTYTHARAVVSEVRGKGADAPCPPTQDRKASCINVLFEVLYSFWSVFEVSIEIPVYKSKLVTHLSYLLHLLHIYYIVIQSCDVIWLFLHRCTCTYLHGPHNL